MEIKRAYITVHYEEPGVQTNKDFNSLQELKKWLDANPEVAEKLGYKKK